MPAGGTIAAAYCFERKCRHIPLESQRADAVVEPSKRYHIRSPACLKDQTSQFVQSLRSAYAQEVNDAGQPENCEILSFRRFYDLEALRP